MVVIVFSCAEPFEQIENTPSKEGTMLNLVKTDRAVLGKTFKNCTILYMYIAQGQGK